MTPPSDFIPDSESCFSLSPPFLPQGFFHGSGSCRSAVAGGWDPKWQVLGPQDPRGEPCNSSHHQLTGEPRGLCCPLATLGEEALRAPIGLPCWLSKWNLEKEKAHQCLREAPPWSQYCQKLTYCLPLVLSVLQPQGWRSSQGRMRYGCQSCQCSVQLEESHLCLAGRGIRKVFI